MNAKSAKSATKTETLASLDSIASNVIEKTGEYRLSVDSAGKSAAAAILSSQAADYSDLCFGFFSSFYGRKVKAENEKDETLAKAIAAAWNATKPSFGRAFHAAGLHVSWPTIRDASGTLAVTTKEEAAAAKNDAKQAAAAQHEAALNRAATDTKVVALNAMKELGPEDFAAHLIDTIDSWSADAKNRQAVIYMVVACYEARELAKSEAAAKRAAAAAKRAAAKSAKSAKSEVAAAA